MIPFHEHMFQMGGSTNNKKKLQRNFMKRCMGVKKSTKHFTSMAKLCKLLGSTYSSGKMRSKMMVRNGSVHVMSYGDIGS